MTFVYHQLNRVLIMTFLLKQLSVCVCVCLGVGHMQKRLLRNESYRHIVEEGENPTQCNVPLILF